MEVNVATYPEPIRFLGTVAQVQAAANDGYQVHQAKGLGDTGTHSLGPAMHFAGPALIYACQNPTS